MKVRAFKGLIPSDKSVGQIVCPPYDVVNEKEARNIYNKNNESFINVVRGEVNFPEGTNPYSDKVYEMSLSNLNKMQDEGKLQREEKQCLYIYSQKMGDHIQTGIVALCHIDDYIKDVIKKHEVTRKDKESDRIKLTKKLKANTGPVFIAYRKDKNICNYIKDVKSSKPIFNLKFGSEYGDVEHTVWRIKDSNKLIDAFKNVESAYIADGHHRSASAVKVGEELRAEKIKNKTYLGEEDFNWFMCVLFAHDELKILPYNRVVRINDGIEKNTILDKISSIGNLVEADDLEVNEPGEVGIYFNNKYYILNLDKKNIEDNSKNKVSGNLDVDILQKKILGPILGITDPRSSKDIDFVGGIRGNDELVKMVDDGRGDIAFSMYPVNIDEIFNVSDAGEIMPAKSTWFEPKLLSGFFVHTFNN